MSGNVNDSNPSSLGKGIPGFQPFLLGGGANSKGSSGMIGGNMRSVNRFIMRDAFGKLTPIANKAGIPLQTLKNQTSITPFRTAFNAGDLRGAVDSSPDSNMWNANQLSGVGNIRSLMFGLGDSTSNNGTALYSGNPKFVYDSSDYIRYRRLSAELKTYNDKSF